MPFSLSPSGSGRCYCWAMALGKTRLKGRPGSHQGPALSATRGPVAELRRASASICIKCANDGPQRVLVRMENLRTKRRAHSRPSAGLTLPSHASASAGAAEPCGGVCRGLTGSHGLPHSLPSGLSGGQRFCLLESGDLQGLPLWPGVTRGAPAVRHWRWRPAWWPRHAAARQISLPSPGPPPPHPCLCSDVSRSTCFLW